MASADHVLEPVLARVASDWSPERRSSLRDLDVPFAPWLRSLGLQADVEDFLLAFCAAMGGGDPEDQSALAILADAVNTGYRFEEAFTDIGQSLSRGTKSLLDAIAADARADVRLGSVARRIRSDDGGAHVDLDSGGTLSASATVVALPLNVWRDLAFDPPLSEDKRWAASTGHAGTSTKVLAIARGVPEAFEGVGWPSTLQALVAGREVDGGRLVTGFSGVRGIDPTDPFAVDKALKEYLPESEVVLSDGHDWNADPFSRGAWFTPRPGWDTRGGEPLTTPEGRLAFATSDVAPSGAGWIEGAIVAGRDAARDTLSMLERSV
jgi:monoamine oxidase